MPAIHTLLVHGGAHGAWCWQEVIAGLERRGAAATAFDLPGSGADPTPRAGITLADYAAAVVQRLDALPPGRVRIVAHSIGGMSLPEVVARRPDRVAELVFVAAVTLAAGERGIDTIPESRRGSYYDMARASGDNTLLPDFTAARDRFFTHLSEDRARAAYDRLTPQPFGPYLTAAPIGVEQVAVPIRYLAAADDRNFDAAATTGFARRAGVDPEVIPGDHCVMLSDPEVLVRALTPGAAPSRLP